MPLHHRIWELVTMICQQSSRYQTSQVGEQEAANLDETVLGDRGETSVGAISGQEAEISRLTWAVIDGKASHDERQRLAELVNAQHERRQS